jgi:hypothetical protein
VSEEANSISGYYSLRLLELEVLQGLSNGLVLKNRYKLDQLDQLRNLADYSTFQFRPVRGSVQ